MPFSGDKSETSVLEQSRIVSSIPFSDNRSKTCVLEQFNCVSDIPLSGDRSASFPCPERCHNSPDFQFVQRPYWRNVTHVVR